MLHLRVVSKNLSLIEILTEAATGGPIKRCFFKFCKFHRRTPVLESFFNPIKDGGTKAPPNSFSL